jgi:hypothetical protein
MNTKYKYEENELREKVKNSHSMANLLSLYGIIPAGGNYATMYRQLKHFNIDTLHWGDSKKRMGWLKGKTHNWSPKIPLEEILVKNSTYGAMSRLKDRLFKARIFDKKCYKCGITEWLNQPAPLELEHINGDKFDNRKENLTILCPNCHAFTPTYRRRKIK